MKCQPIRGTRDLIGQNVDLYNLVVSIAKKHAVLSNFEELITPIFEFKEIFQRTLGETSDVVTKETYTFQDRDESFITLRPEFTAGVVRALISNGLTQNLPQKLFSYGPLFRHERPQKARYRQFSQINFEYIGAVGAHTDAEVISLAFNILNELGLGKHVKLELNSIGDSESRNNYRAALVEFYSKYINDLSADSRLRLEKNPLRILDSKDETDKKISESAPVMHNYFSKETIEYFEKLKAYLERLNIPYILNSKLVRGLDYYTHTVFEFTTDMLGSQGTVLAGGRYDGLVELMGGPSIPAVGFAAGIERIFELIKEIGYEPASKNLISIIPIGESAISHALSASQQLKNAGYCNEIFFHKKIAKMFEKADKQSSSYAVILGEDEIRSGICKIKNMKTGKEESTNLSDLAKYAFVF